MLQCKIKEEVFDPNDFQQGDSKRMELDNHDSHRTVTTNSSDRPDYSHKRMRCLDGSRPSRSWGDSLREGQTRCQTKSALDLPSELLKTIPLTICAKGEPIGRCRRVVKTTLKWVLRNYLPLECAWSSVTAEDKYAISQELQSMFKDGGRIDASWIKSQARKIQKYDRERAKNDLQETEKIPSDSCGCGCREDEG